MGEGMTTPDTRTGQLGMGVPFFVPSRLSRFKAHRKRIAEGKAHPHQHNQDATKSQPQWNHCPMKCPQSFYPKTVPSVPLVLSVLLVLSVPFVLLSELNGTTGQTGHILHRLEFLP